MARNDIHFRRMQNMKGLTQLLRRVVAVNLNEADAQLLETQLIKHWGIESFGGVLTNINHGDGFEPGQSSGRPRTSARNIWSYVRGITEVVTLLPANGFESKAACRTFIANTLACSQERATYTHWCLVAAGILVKEASSYPVCAARVSEWQALADESRFELIDRLWNQDWVNGLLDTNL